MGVRTSRGYKEEEADKSEEVMLKIECETCSVPECLKRRYQRHKECVTHYMKMFRYGDYYFQRRLKPILSKSNPYRQTKVNGDVVRVHVVVWENTISGKCQKDITYIMPTKTS